MNRIITVIHQPLIIVIAWLTALLWAPNVAAMIGQSLELATGQSLTIQAETFTFQANSNRFVVTGKVTITYQQSTLKADRVEFDIPTGNAIATGHVIYEEGGETIVAEQANLNIDTELGKLHIAEISLLDDHYITGQTVNKTAAETYEIQKGSYTACSGKSPAWLLRCSPAKVEQGEYLQTWNTVAYIKGIPVFYFPYFVYPIKTDRQTGFLVPEIGTNSANGFSVGNAFFWAISPSQDATLRHTYYANRGHLLNLEYRYLYSEQTDGNVEGKYLRDQVDNTVYQRLQWEHKQGLPYGIVGRLDLNLTSNDQFDETFENRIEDRTKRDLRSDLSFTKNFSRHSIILSANRMDDLRQETSERADQRLPELKVTSQQQQLFGLPFYVQQETQVAHLQRLGTDKMEFYRLDVHPTLSWPLTVIPQALTLNPRVSWRDTYYTRDATTAADQDLPAQTVNRQYYEASLGITGPKVNRVFDFGRARRIQKLKHLIEPSLSFSYRPALDDLNLPRFDGIDTLQGTPRSRMLNYGLTQWLLAKQVSAAEWTKFRQDETNLTADELPTDIAEFVSLAITQSYDLEAERRNFSEIFTSVKTTPIRNYELRLDANYDLYVQSFVKTVVDLKGKVFNPLTLNVRWDRTATVNTTTDEITDVRKSLNVSSYLQLFKGAVNLGYSGRFNISEGERIEDVFEFAYRPQCWSLNASYTQQLVETERTSRFNVRIELKHLGKLFEFQE